MENLGQRKFTPNDHQVKISLEMQIKLAEAHNEPFEKFVETRARNFRVVIDANPELLSKFESDPQGTLQEIGGILYH